MPDKLVKNPGLDKKCRSTSGLGKGRVPYCCYNRKSNIVVNEEVACHGLRYKFQLASIFRPWGVQKIAANISVISAILAEIYK